MKNATKPIQALVPRDNDGHQFVCYADCCSGVPGGPHEENFADVNRVVACLKPQPEFICFPGDEIRGLSGNEEGLLKQWRHWFDHEMKWLDREATPVYNTTGNHTAYDNISADVFRRVMAHLPQNGPQEQKGLSYFVRRRDLLLVFVNTLWSGLGGEGRVETEWLDRTLDEHSDAKYKLVCGHHPVFPVNGFSGECQREIASHDGRRFWDMLVRHKVRAYLCSHILAFDVQVHRNVLQILTGGAGTMPRMPEGIEYLHCVQAAIDTTGLRYQVLDTSGNVREWLRWPIEIPPSTTWQPFESRESGAFEDVDSSRDAASARFTAWRFSGVCSSDDRGEPQTILSGWDSDHSLSSIWIGLRGKELRLCVLLSPVPGRSPHLWSGPELAPGERFEIQLAVHTGMGPGGLLWRRDDTSPWSSMTAASPWGAERLTWPTNWSFGHDRHGPDASPFRGTNLDISLHTHTEHL